MSNMKMIKLKNTEYLIIGDYWPIANVCVCVFAECMCYSVGTVPQACPSPDECQCDQYSGQCHCQPNVIGQNCDRCAPDTWNIASGTGCLPCDCDPEHSFGSSCNEVGENKTSCPVGGSRTACLSPDMVSLR